MTNRFLISVAAAALIAGTGLANAQGTGMTREAPSAGSTQQSAPSSDRAAPSAATPMNRNDASESKGSDSGMKSTQSDEKMQPGGAKSQRAQDTAPGQKSKSMSSENDGKAAKDQKAEGRSGNTNAADSKGAADKNMNAESRNPDSKMDNKSAADSKSSTTTTGQAGAGAKLSTEQRTKITTVIKQQNIAPATNINFSISVGTRVPREVGFHPLPAEIVTVYPDWRGYEFFLARDQIIVVNPRTLEIVAVLDV
jgi:uncharacterized protein DUF1236